MNGQDKSWISRQGTERHGIDARFRISTFQRQPSASARRSGFTLVEVTLALVVVALGLLGVFHLFPVGLRASLDATSETRCAQFADEVFNQVYADAAAQTTPAGFSALFNGDVDIDLGGSSTLIDLNGTTPKTIKYVDNPGNTPDEYVRYLCKSSVDSNNRHAGIDLKVAYGRAGGYTNEFYTEVYNFGM